MSSEFILRMLVKRTEDRVHRMDDDEAKALNDWPKRGSSQGEKLSGIALVEIACLGGLIGDAELKNFGEYESWVNDARKFVENGVRYCSPLLLSFLQRAEDSTQNDCEWNSVTNSRFAALNQFLAITTEMTDDVDTQEFERYIPNSIGDGISITNDENWLARQVYEAASTRVSESGKSAPDFLVGARRYLQFLSGLNETLIAAGIPSTFTSGMWWYHGDILSNAGAIRYLDSVSKHINSLASNTLKLLSLNVHRDPLIAHIDGPNNNGTTI